MTWIFFILLFLLSILAAGFMGVAWAKQSKKTWWIPASAIVIFFAFTTSCYLFLGQAPHIIYKEQDTALRQIADLLDDSVPLTPALHQKINEELSRQETRSSAWPSVWLLKGQQALTQNNYTEAKNAYQKAYEYEPDDPDIAVSYAQTWYLAQDQQVTPELTQFLSDFQLNHPDQPGLLNLLAVIAYNNKEYTTAIRYWQQLLPQYSSSSVEGETLTQAIDDAKAKEQK